MRRLDDKTPASGAVTAVQRGVDGGPATAPIDACKLISADDIAKLLGKPIEGKPTGTDPDMPGCTWENRGHLRVGHGGDRQPGHRDQRHASAARTRLPRGRHTRPGRDAVPRQRHGRVRRGWALEHRAGRGGRRCRARRPTTRPSTWPARSGLNCRSSRTTVTGMSESQHTIAGTVLTMPVRVRKADVHTAMFSVERTRRSVSSTTAGCRVCQHRPGRAVANLIADPLRRL